MRHDFTVDQSVLKSLIGAQSGTVHKAIAELITNAIDAKATRCDITLNLDGFAVSDDGEGFDIAHFHEHFGRFGFSHDDHIRHIGRFGLGRGQVLSLARTAWRTRTIEALVDIQKSYSYDLTEGLDDQPGVRVEGMFYQRLDGATHYEALNELRKLARYAQIDVVLNGDRISRHPDAERWDHQDDVAWYRFTEGGRVSVFSQGIWVQDRWSGPYGIGGVVVTKVGHPLQQNMARNDVLTTQCKVWKTVEARLRAAGRSAAGQQKKQNRLTDEARTAEVQSLLCSGDSSDIYSLFRGRHVTTVVGSHISLDTLSTYPVWTVADERSLPAERLHKSGAVAVLSRRTLERFSALTVEDLLLKLRRCMAQHSSWLPLRFTDIQTREAIADCEAYQASKYEVIDPKDLTKRQKQALSVARGASKEVARLLGKKGRHVVPGSSDDAEAWTDGATFIAIDTKVLGQAMSRGLAGWGKLVAVLVHEYLHDAASNLAHGHTPDFYEAFHEAMIDLPVVNVVASAFSSACIRAKVTRPLASNLAKIVELDVEIGRDEVIEAGMPVAAEGD